MGDEENSNLTTEAISNWTSYQRERRDQDSPPVVTVTYTQASYDEMDKFDIEERTSKRPSTAQEPTEPVNEYFKGIRNSNQPEIQMAIPISPSAMTQQQRREQQEHVTPIKSNRTSTPTSPK